MVELDPDRFLELVPDGRGKEDALYWLVYGRIDRFVMRRVAFVLKRTWVRFTRRTPQQLGRWLMVPYVILQLMWLEANHDFGAHPDVPMVIFNMALACIVGWCVENWSRRLDSLSSTSPTHGAFLTAKSIAKYRPILPLWTCAAVVLFIAKPGAALGISIATNTVATFSWYVLTIGRPWPRAKKARKSYHLHLPRLNRLASQLQ